MTVYKAFRNFIIALAIVALIVTGSLIGFSAYKIYDYTQNSQYVVSKFGSSGEEVKNIQKKLSSLGFYGGSVVVIYGNNTKSAVKAFQKSCGITADGICGKTTLLYLGLSGGSSSNNTEYSNSDVELLAKVISAEARGESYEGQVAVGAVILNRVKHPSFPDSISGVVYQKGAFSCVNDSNWYAAVADSSKRAAIDALNGWDPSGGAIYYFNASKTSDAFMHSRQVIKTIGNHKFLKDLINLTFCCQQATVITDFSDLAAVGRDHYMNLHGGSASVDELNALDGKGTARQLIESGGGTITPYTLEYN